MRTLQDWHGEALDGYAHEVDFVARVDHALRARVCIELQQRIGEAHRRLGDRARGLAALDLALEACDRRLRSVPADAMSPYYAACAHALRGNRDTALACLGRTARRRPMLTARRAGLEPALASLREAPRFQAVLAAAQSWRPRRGVARRRGQGGQMSRRHRRCIIRETRSRARRPDHR